MKEMAVFVDGGFGANGEKQEKNSLGN